MALNRVPNLLVIKVSLAAPDWVTIGQWFHVRWGSLLRCRRRLGWCLTGTVQEKKNKESGSGISVGPLCCFTTMTYINLFVTLADIVFCDGHCWEAMIQVAQCCMTVDPKHTSGNLYRPQRSWAKVIFSQACVQNSVHGGGGGCLPQCMLGYQPQPPQSRHSPGTRHPPSKEQTHIPGADTPLGADTPWNQAPPREADCSIRSTSGRYASYWNAFLLGNKLQLR